jgi:hypothetical protein
MAYDATDIGDIDGFAKGMGIDYPILVGGESERNAVASDYSVDFLPETFYIGRDGKVVEKIIGLKSKSEIEESIRKALVQIPAISVAETKSSSPVEHPEAPVAVPKSSSE